MESATHGLRDRKRIKSTLTNWIGFHSNILNAVILQLKF
ncbi:rCG56016 [Rattus norvegicus]|uniref:RCG56016 n=1 Tax=Rattus norvegicus TaxID=10116 RepID=A6IBJ4_RAT|nr:rCG56016 [Rattus norvegicus]